MLEVAKGEMLLFFEGVFYNDQEVFKHPILATLIFRSRPYSIALVSLFLGMVQVRNKLEVLPFYWSLMCNDQVVS